MNKEFIGGEQEKSDLDKTHLEYERVLGLFPEIKAGDIEFKFNEAEHFLADFSIYDKEIFRTKREAVRRPVLMVGPKFLELGQSEREAVLAHELGHYLDSRDYDTYKIEELLVNKFKFVFQHKESPAEVKRLQEWSLGRELRADDYVIQAGLGKDLLRLLKKRTEDMEGGYLQDESLARIGHIENKIKNKYE